MRRMIASGVLALATANAGAQSLFEIQPFVPLDAGTEVAGGGQLRGMSLFLVEPPRPRRFEQHDLVTIIISENSSQQADHSVDAEKSYELDSAINQFLDLARLLELRIDQGSTDVTLGDLDYEAKFEGDSSYSRNDTFSDRVTATVIDVKPNGTIVLEARRTIEMDEERKVLVLSGVCNGTDVTEQNTIRSNQIADMALIVKHTGEMKRANTKGIIPRALETIFNF